MGFWLLWWKIIIKLTKKKKKMSFRSKKIKVIFLKWSVRKKNANLVGPSKVQLSNGKRDSTFYWWDIWTPFGSLLFSRWTWLYKYGRLSLRCVEWHSLGSAPGQIWEAGAFNGIHLLAVSSRPSWLCFLDHGWKGKTKVQSLNMYGMRSLLDFVFVQRKIILSLTEDYK